MTYINSERSGLLALQQELPDWKLDKRTTTWMWLVLREWDLGGVGEELRGLHFDDFGTPTMYEDMVRALRNFDSLAGLLFDHKMRYLLQEQDLQRIGAGDRQIKWLLDEFRQFWHDKGLPRIEYPESLTLREQLIARIDFWRESLSEKRRIIETWLRRWADISDMDKHYSWFNSGEQKKEKLKVAWEWYRENSRWSLPRGPQPSKLDDFLSYLDFSKLTQDERRFHIGEIKKEFKRRQSNKNLEGKSQTNLALSKECRHQLNILAKQQQLTMVAVVERLIQYAAHHGMPNEAGKDHQVQLF